MDLDLKALILKTDTQKGETRKPPPKHRQGERFLKGPIPLDWLAKAGQQKGHALHVSIALWHEAGVQKNAIVKVPSKLTAEMGAGRHAKYSGLEALERAGLVRVIERRRGCSPVVEILSVTYGHDGQV